MIANSYSYNGILIESRIWSIEWRHLQCPWMTFNPEFKGTPSTSLRFRFGYHSLQLNISNIANTLIYVITKD